MNLIRYFLATVAGLTLILVSLSAPASGSEPPRAISSRSGVEITDYDGHPHRTAPKRVGQHLNLGCRSSSDDDQTLNVGVYFETGTGRGPNHHLSSYRDRSLSLILRLRQAGIYGMVISGGGFDRLVIRTQGRDR